MLKHTLAIIMAVAAVSLATPGMGSAGVACTPHCASVQSSNSGGELKGLNRANEVAGVHGADGRANAVEKQDAHKKGGSGVSTGAPPPVSPPPVPPTVVEPPVPPPDPCSGC
jgi:hypothetical protein